MSASAGGGEPWCAPESGRARLWALYPIVGTGAGPLLGLFRGTEAELASWVPEGFVWQWQREGSPCAETVAAQR